MVDKQGIDQVAYDKVRFPDQVAEPRMAPEPAGSMKRVTRGRLEGHEAFSNRVRELLGGDSAQRRAPGLGSLR